LSLLTVRGEHLIRALDVNLPMPIASTYPIFDSTGSVFTGGYYTVDSFSTWQFSRTLDCPWPPCINPLGRPFNATVSGDPNQDGNDLNDRLPGYSRNAFTGPDYATTDLRLTRTLRFGERYKLNLIAESFNLLNRDNQRVAITSNGMVASATTFVQNSVTANIAPYPGYYQLPNNFMKPNAAYAPRQIQLALKFIF